MASDLQFFELILNNNNKGKESYTSFISCKTENKKIMSLRFNDYSYIKITVSWTVLVMGHLVNQSARSGW